MKSCLIVEYLGVEQQEQHERSRRRAMRGTRDHEIISARHLVKLIGNVQVLTCINVVC